ncbi:lipopolysaccharide assembly protein LapA domain-containing protein [Aldersonia sp. NBC_00410]|uniref:LapA family protein n=1 Tax=Aldersonia sp. NBC_00410 TaxID=2975954 RepID=UPI002254C18C|nr:lipopolysaccharide assembly protein LapA domain-containing protein [Aldersonia sp. NBC_00410]MCX5046220.1 lipopolysaccharide assembly protein LapA domain-containing protein [Aldersonia sp. NBC_00410]
MATNSDPTAQPGSAPSTTPPQPGSPSATAPPIRKIKRTRVSAAWIALIVGIVVMVLLLIFILQNLESTTVSLLFWEFSLPLGVGILLAAIAGAVIMAIVGGWRIMQIRKVAKRPQASARKA